MSQLQVTGEAKIRDIQGPVVANSGVITALDGAASQYVRGDGTLADFPTSTGGGSSVSYYLNSSVSQGTIGGVAYRQLGKTPIAGAGTDIVISANGYVASYLTDANDPALLEVPAGNFNCEFYFAVNSNNHDPYVYAEVYKYDGTTFTLIGSSQSVPEYLTNGTTLSPYYFAIPVTQTTLAITDRIAIRIYVNVDGRVVTLHTENNHLCQVVTTFSKGLTSLNNLTRQVQFLGTGTSGTDFNIASSGDTHTFNIPNAGVADRGLITNLAQTIGGAKTFSSVLRTDGGFLLKDSTLATVDGYTSIGGVVGSISIGYAISSTPYINDLEFAPATSNTYTFPNASGTLALTSNLSAYVPYTGATQSVNLGTYGLKAGLITTEGGYNFKILSSGTLFENGYSVLSSVTGNVSITQAISAGNLKTFTFDFSSWATNTSRTYTLPDLSGTLALLEGTQTFTGVKTFSENPIINGTGTNSAYTILQSAGTNKWRIGNNYAAGVNTFDIFAYDNSSTPLSINSNGAMTLSANVTTTGAQFVQNGFYLSNANAGATTFYTHMWGADDGINFGLRNGTGGARFIFPSANSYIYTFPATTGTLALTSNLSAYLPLTGGTLTGALSGTSATFSGNGLFGGSMNAGNAGTFTLSVGVPGTTAGGLQLWAATNQSSFLQFGDGTSAADNYRGYVGYNHATDALTLGSAGADRLTIASTGAATFSGFVGINGSPGTGFPLEAYINSSTAYTTSSRGNVMRLYNSNTSANIFAGIELGGAGTANDGLAGINAVVTGSGSAALTFYTRDSNTFAERLRITSSGNVGIGTSSPGAGLEVVTDSGVFNALRVVSNRPQSSGTDVAIAFRYLSDSTNYVNGGLIVVGKDNTTSGNQLGNMQFYTNGGSGIVERMRITSGGVVNVLNDLGVGTATPSGKIHGVGINTSGSNNALYLENAVATILLRVRNDGAIYTGTAANSPVNLTTGSAANVFVESGSGLLYRSTSSLKYKKNVQNYTKGLAEVMQMRPVYYKGKGENDGDKQFAGLIAEEVHELGLTEFVQYAEDGSPDALAYQNMIALAFKAIQELTQKVNELESKIK